MGGTCTAGVRVCVSVPPHIRTSIHAHVRASTHAHARECKSTRAHAAMCEFEVQRGGCVPKQGKGVLLIKGLPHTIDVPRPTSNHVSHPVPYPLAGREKAMSCGKPPLEVASGQG